jgi:hypothetical protein
MRSVESWGNRRRQFRRAGGPRIGSLQPTPVWLRSPSNKLREASSFPYRLIWRISYGFLRGSDQVVNSRAILGFSSARIWISSIDLATSLALAGGRLDWA